MNRTANGTGNGTRLPVCSQTIEMDSFAIANIVLLFFLFTSLGMTISAKDFKANFANPKGLILSQFGQFIILPLVGWGIAVGMALPVPFAVGLIAVTTAPGGAISNIIALIFQADIPLSVAATTASSILAIGFMPLNQYIYLVATKLAPGVCLVVSGIVLSAAIVVAGTLFGLVLKPWMQKRKMYRSIRFVLLLGTLCGTAIVVLGFVANLGGGMPITAVPGKILGAVFLPCLIGTVFGYLSGWVFGLKPPSCITIALEVGVQNKAVAISALTFLFPAGSSARTISYGAPILYALFATCFSVAWVAVAWQCGLTNLPRGKGCCEAMKQGWMDMHDDSNLKAEIDPQTTAKSSAEISAEQQDTDPSSKTFDQVANV